MVRCFNELYKCFNYPNNNDDLFKKFWPASLHLIGKDILRFHAVYWPAFLLAANIKPLKNLWCGWILSGDEKMSKSKGNILDPIEVIKEYGLDPLRYYLIKEVSFGNDGNISQESWKTVLIVIWQILKLMSTCNGVYY